MTPVFVSLVFIYLGAVSASAVDNNISEVVPYIYESIASANAGTNVKLNYGDVLPSRNRNADPCTARGCTWDFRQDGKIYVPVSISDAYTQQQQSIIINSLLTFHESTCIRFMWRRSTDRDYIHFFPGNGCYSYVGRQGRMQLISLQSNGCLFTGIVQHEVLHALGFHHEQNRSDRDDHVTIITQNIEPGLERNFEKVDTNNLETPYDFDSIMHYHKYAFSRNNQPTIVPIENPNRVFGRATAMSQNDIDRVNRLYCK